MQQTNNPPPTGCSLSLGTFCETSASSGESEAVPKKRKASSFLPNHSSEGEPFILHEGKVEELQNKISRFKVGGSSLDQAKKWGNLGRRSEELAKLALDYQRRYRKEALENIVQEWEETGIDPQAWEDKLFGSQLEPDEKRSVQSRISKQFKLAMGKERLTHDYFPYLKIIFITFLNHRSDPSLEPKLLKRIDEKIPFFEDTVTFVVEGQPFYLSKRLLLSLQSSYFNGLFANSSDPYNREPIELDVDLRTFELLKEWLQRGSVALFVLNLSELLAFMRATCRFDFPTLMLACDSQLAHIVLANDKNVFLLFEEIYQFQKENRELGVYFSFPEVEAALQAALKKQNVILKPMQQIRLLEGAKDIYLCIRGPEIDVKDLDVCLSLLETLSILKEAESVDLELYPTQILKGQQDRLVTLFPNLRKIAINFFISYVCKWDFLVQFERLTEIVIFSRFFNDDRFFMLFKETFPKKEGWQISFDLTCFFEEEQKPLGVNHFVQLKLLESRPSRCHDWPPAIKSCMEDHDLKRLMDGQKVDFASPMLDLSGMEKLSLEAVVTLIEHMDDLKELNLNLQAPFLSSLVKRLPSLGLSGLSKLILPYSFFGKTTLQLHCMLAYNLCAFILFSTWLQMTKSPVFLSG